jgi:hypothetical protein
MARVQYGGGVEELRGSIAGNTFSQNSSGCIVRARRVPHQPLSPQQLLPLSKLNYLQQLWRVLDPGYQDEWDALAAAHTRQNMFGKITQLSGAQWYLAVNSFRLLNDLTPLDGPETYSLPTAPYIDIVNISLSAVSIDFTDGPPPGDHVYVIYSTFPTFSFNKYIRSHYRLLAIMTEYDSNPFVVTSGFLSAFGIGWPPSNPCYGNLQIIAYSGSKATGYCSNGIFQSTNFSF